MNELHWDMILIHTKALFERFEAAVNLTPPLRIVKWIRKGDKLAKVSKVDKGTKTAGDVGKKTAPVATKEKH